MVMVLIICDDDSRRNAARNEAEKQIAELKPKELVNVITINAFQTKIDGAFTGSYAPCPCHEPLIMIFSGDYPMPDNLVDALRIGLNQYYAVKHVIWHSNFYPAKTQ